MSDNDVCIRCSKISETFMHVLIACDVAHSIWENFITMEYEQWSPFFSFGISQLIDFNLMLNDIASIRGHWPIVFDIIINMSWMERNQIVFSRTPLEF